MRAAALGVAGALPVVARGDGDAIRGALRSQADAIVKESSRASTAAPSCAPLPLRPLRARR